MNCLGYRSFVRGILWLSYLYVFSGCEDVSNSIPTYRNNITSEVDMKSRWINTEDMTLPADMSTEDMNLPADMSTREDMNLPVCRLMDIYP